jgi:hypothetical protein
VGSTPTATSEGNPRSLAVNEMLQSHDLRGKRIGIQLDSFGLLLNLYLELCEARRAGVS